MSKYFEDYLQISPTVVKQTNELPDLPACSLFKISSKKSSVCVSSMRGKLVITESSASVVFKVSDKSNNFFSLHCKPTAFGYRLSHTDLDVVFKINVNASNKKKNITFSISDGKVNDTVTNYKKTVPRSNEIDHENDSDTLLTKPESYPELIIIFHNNNNTFKA